MMEFKKSLVGLMCLVVLACSSAVSADVMLFDPVAHAKVWAERIANLERERKFANVESQTQQFVNWLKRYDKNYPALDSFIETAYNQKASAEANQGKYNEAGNTIRESHAWKPNPANIDKVLKYEQKDLAQREFFNKTLEFQNKRIEIQRSILNLARVKEKLIQNFLKMKDVTKEQLETLQGQLKRLTGKITALRTELNDFFAAFSKDTEKFRKDEIIFNHRQAFAINQKARVAGRLIDAINGAESRVAKGLTEITEKFKFSWPGLEDMLGKMKDLQVKIMDIQKQMLAIMDKKPLTDADKAKLMELKAQLDKLVTDHDKLLRDIETAFMDTKTFSKLSSDQQVKFMEMFKVIRDANNVIDLTNAKIDAFLKEMNVKFGDLNGDGKVDRLDMATMIRKFLLAPPWFRFKRLYDKAADLDGDGQITWADYNLLKEAVIGDRKTFPVDPANLTGDMDGNGKLDNEDVYDIAKFLSDPKSFPKVFVKIADMNGDGKVDILDISALIQKITSVISEPAPAPGGTGVATVAPLIGGTGAATGVTTGDTGTGDAADSLDSAY